MKKRRKPKRWVEERIGSIDTILGQMLQRMSIIETILESYIEMRRDTHKISKFLDKKRKKKDAEIKDKRDRREAAKSG